MIQAIQNRTLNIVEVLLNYNEYVHISLSWVLGYLCRSDAVKSRSWKMENAKHVGLMMLDVDVLTGHNIKPSLAVY